MHRNEVIDPLEQAYRRSVLRDIERRVARHGTHQAQPHADRARQFMPFAALKGYEAMAHGREFAAIPKHEPTAEEARAFSDTVSGLAKDDVMRVTWYDQGAHRVTEGPVAYKDESLRTIRVGTADIAFADIESIEPV